MDFNQTFKLLRSRGPEAHRQDCLLSVIWSWDAGITYLQFATLWHQAKPRTRISPFQMTHQGCVCVCGPLLPRVNPQNPQTKQPEFWIRFFGAGGWGPVTGTSANEDYQWQGVETYLRIKGGGCTWVFMTAGGRHEEFLGLSWQLESSPLTSTKRVLKKATPLWCPVVSKLDRWAFSPDWFRNPESFMLSKLHQAWLDKQQMSGCAMDT